VTRQAIYDRLRAIGVSVESADAVSEALEPLPDKKVEAFFLWGMGYNNCEVAKLSGFSEGTIRNLIKLLRIDL
jgi:DNA-directed RNA polymerase specialized sigma24 family protein